MLQRLNCFSERNTPQLNWFLEARILYELKLSAKKKRYDKMIWDDIVEVLLVEFNTHPFG